MSSTTVAKMVYRVRHMIAATSVSEPPSLPTILDALDCSLIEINAGLPGRAGLSTAYITLVPNDYDYTLGAGEAEPHSLQEFRLQSSGQPVYRRSLAEWMAYRTGNPSAVGEPIILAFAEAATGILTAYVWPTPATADVIEAIRATAVASVFQGLAGTNLTSTTVDFGTYGTLAVCHLAAASLLPDGPDRVRHERQAANLRHEEAVRLASAYAGDGSLPWAI